MAPLKCNKPWNINLSSFCLSLSITVLIKPKYLRYTNLKWHKSEIVESTFLSRFSFLETFGLVIVILWLLLWLLIVVFLLLVASFNCSYFNFTHFPWFSKTTSIIYEHTTVHIFSLHVIPCPGVDHLIELQARTWTAFLCKWRHHPM